jgi:hypothetical protein
MKRCKCDSDDDQYDTDDSQRLLDDEEMDAITWSNLKYKRFLMPHVQKHVADALRPYCWKNFINAQSASSPDQRMQNVLHKSLNEYIDSTIRVIDDEVEGCELKIDFSEETIGPLKRDFIVLRAKANSVKEEIRGYIEVESMRKRQHKCGQFRDLHFLNEKLSEVKQRVDELSEQFGKVSLPEGTWADGEDPS